jgi:hypothetical protein
LHAVTHARTHSASHVGAQLLPPQHSCAQAMRLAEESQGLAWAVAGDDVNSAAPASISAANSVAWMDILAPPITPGADEPLKKLIPRSPRR